MLRYLYIQLIHNIHTHVSVSFFLAYCHIIILILIPCGMLLSVALYISMECSLFYCSAFFACCMLLDMSERRIGLCSLTFVLIFSFWFDPFCAAYIVSETTAIFSCFVASKIIDYVVELLKISSQP